MVTLMTIEFESSEAVYREMDTKTAYAIARKCGFYKAQIINEFGVVDYEF
ncbi:TPA: hypothetical protein ACTNSM_004409 [Salmonella enterica subsp. enterica serovar Enteritidis]|nr:hypothetical protein [Salmonella enterica]